MSSADRMRQLEKAEANLWISTKNTRQDIAFVRSASKGDWKVRLPKSRRPNRIGMGTADENVEIRISDSDEWQRIARHRVGNETRGYAVGICHVQEHPPNGSPRTDLRF